MLMVCRSVSTRKVLKFSSWNLTVFLEPSRISNFQLQKILEWTPFNGESLSNWKFLNLKLLFENQNFWYERILFASDKIFSPNSAKRFTKQFWPGILLQNASGNPHFRGARTVQSLGLRAWTVQNEQCEHRKSIECNRFFRFKVVCTFIQWNSLCTIWTDGNLVS